MERRRICAHYERQLAPFSTALVGDFRRSAEAVSGLLTAEELRQWAEEGLALTRQSWRSWEAASEYFRASVKVLPLLGFPSLQRWAQYGRELAETSSALSTAYFRASPETLPHLTLQRLPEWVGLGRYLYKGTWRSASLAVQFFDHSPTLFSRLTLREVGVLVRFVDALCDRSYDLAAHCLGVAPHVLSPLPEGDREGFLRFAEVLASSGWADARSYLERGPALLAGVQQAQRVRFLSLARELARREGRQAFGLFAEAARALGQVDPRSHGTLLALAEELVACSPQAAMEFLKAVPQVLSRIRLDDLLRWHGEGKRLLETSPEGGEAYFRLESSRGEEMLESLSSRVSLTRVGEILRMYCKALTGDEIAIHSSEVLAEKGIGWVETEVPSTEGTAIYLPPWVEEFPAKEANFVVYKVYATHQAGHLEFHTFTFDFEREGKVFPSLRKRVEQERRRRNGENPSDEGVRQPLTDMERFFDLFDDRRLASDLFAIVEDTRIDVLIEREYAGIRQAYRERRELELERRPRLEGMPLRQALLENLVRASLGGMGHLRWPKSLQGLLKEAVGILRAVQRPEATVEDSAEATIRLYHLAQRIPNRPWDALEDVWEELGGHVMQEMCGSELPQGGPESQLPEGENPPYESPSPVGFRGEFKPELVQLLMRMREERSQGQGTPLSISPEQLKAMLEKSVEVSLSDLGEAGQGQQSELLMINLMKETGSPQREQVQMLPLQEGQPVAGLSTADDDRQLPVEPRYYYYDEWDFRAGDYKPKWCRVVEQEVGEGSTQFYDQTLARYATLAAQTRRQFELLRPELFRKIKRLLDGEEFDLDAVTEYIVERRAGHTPSGKVYWRRNKVERDVAVAFLLDMSASTDEEITKHERPYSQGDFDDPRRYFSWWMARRAQDLLVPPKRIIDLEKESIVLLIKALETIGDRYGIYGFSGYGRENVEFYVVKDLDEAFSERVKRRIDRIAPVRSTRMGPAIRHATAKLERQDCKVRILFLVSDGRPQDHGYGRDRTEKEYAIHDTHMGLLEAKRKGMIPFCLTVDRYGHDYLKQMCDDIGYAVVPDIESLPSRITTLYRELTR